MAYIIPPAAVELTPSPVPRGRFLDIAPQWGEGVRWYADGVTWEPFDFGSLHATGTDACSPAAHGATPRTCLAYETAVPFALEDAWTSNALATLDDSDGDVGVQRDRWELLRSAAFASELITGAAAGGRALSSDATAPALLPFGSAAVSGPTAIAVFEAHLATVLQGGRGVIHVPPVMLPSLMEVVTQVGDHWETPTGHIVIADAGYQGALPPDGQAAASTTQAWMYASGPVMWAYAPGIGGDVRVDITTNEVTAQMTGYGILLWDQEPVSAVLASIIPGA